MINTQIIIPPVVMNNQDLSLSEKVLLSYLWNLQIGHKEPLVLTLPTNNDLAKIFGITRRQIGRYFSQLESKGYLLRKINSYNQRQMLKVSIDN